MNDEYIYVDNTEAGTSLNCILSKRNLERTLGTKEIIYNKDLYIKVNRILKSIDEGLKIDYTTQYAIDFVSHSGTMKWNTRNIANQVDFWFEDKHNITWAVELKATMKTLKDAIKDPNRITKSKTIARKKGYKYHLLIVLLEHIDEQMTWMERARIPWGDWERFRKLRSIPKTILKMKNQIYAEPVKDWFLDEQLHQSRYYQKQELILDWMRSKQ